jgi:hypothetical protein
MTRILTPKCLRINKAIIYLICLLWMYLALPANGFSQAPFNPDSKYYKKFRKELKRWLRTDKNAFSESVTYPDKWKDESVILLYRRHSIEHNKVNAYYFTRYRLKLNDLRAVENYSHIDFSSSDYLEIKIIKPNGKIERVNLKNAVKKEIKLSRPGYESLFKNNELKIALNGLETGDILDICFLSTTSSIETYLKIEYPTRFVKIDILMPRKMQVVGQSLNGAPKMKVSKKKRKIYYELTDSLLEKSKLEPLSIRRLTDPLIRYKIIHRVSFINNGFSTNQGKVKQNVSSREIAKHLRGRIHKYDVTRNLYYYEFIKNYGYSLNDEDYFLQYYYLVRDGLFKDQITFNLRNPMNHISYQNLLNSFAVHLKKRKIPYRFIVLSSKYNGGINSALFEEDIEVGLEVDFPDKTYIISHFNAYSHPDIYHHKLEEQELVSFSKKDLKKGRSGNKVVLDISKASDNVIDISMEVKALVFPDSTQIKQKTIYSGHCTEGRNDFGNHYQNLLDEYSTFARTPKYHKEKKPLLFFTNRALYARDAKVNLFWEEEKRKAAEFINQRNKKRKELLKEMLQNEYEVFSVDSFFPIHNGASIENKKVSFYAEFKIGEIFSKSGQIQILHIGKLLGELPEIQNINDRSKREQDFFQSFNNTLKMRISVEVPRNMTLNDLSALNTSLENKVGKIMSSAHFEGNQIIWDFQLIREGYKHQPEDWPAYLELTDMLAKLSRTKLASE